MASRKPAAKSAHAKKAPKAQARPSAAVAPTTPHRTAETRFRGRFEAAIAALEANPQVVVLWKSIGVPADPEHVRARAEEIGWALDDDALAFYTEMNGCVLVWCAKGDASYSPKIHKPRRGHPSHADFDEIGAQLARPKAFAFPSIDSLATEPREYPYQPGEKVRRIAIDRPGAYYTPAIVLDGKTAVVKVGEDYGAAWDSVPAYSFGDYVETVLATWGDVQARVEIFNRKKYGVGRAYWEASPWTLDSLLPALSLEQRDQRALLQSLGAGALPDSLIVPAIQALSLKDNDRLVAAAMQALSQMPHRLAPHAGALLANAGAQAQKDSILDLVSQLAGTLPQEQLEACFRLDSSRWMLRARLAARGGARSLPMLRAALEEAHASKPTEEERRMMTKASSLKVRRHEHGLRAAFALVWLLGPDAADLRDLVDPARWRDHGVPHDVAGLAALAAASVEPSSAARHADAIASLVSPHHFQAAACVASGDRTGALARVFQRLDGATQAAIAQAFEPQLQGHVDWQLVAPLAGLGTAGFDLALGLARQRPTDGPIQIAVFHRMLPYASLGPDERARLRDWCVEHVGSDWSSARVLTCIELGAASAEDFHQTNATVAANAFDDLANMDELQLAWTLDFIHAHAVDRERVVRATQKYTQALPRMVLRPSLLEEGRTEVASRT